MEPNRPTNDLSDDFDATAPDDEVLIGRIVDGEADSDDQGAFEHRADQRPELWRTLALRQRDMRLLADEVDRRTACAETIELQGWNVCPRRVTWPLALSGWAAVLILSFTWIVLSTATDRGQGLDSIVDRAPLSPQVELTPMDHLRAYVDSADWPVSELQPTLNEAMPMPDGGLRLNYTRRIQEEIIVDAEQVDGLLKTIAENDEIPVDTLTRLLEDHQRRHATTRQGPGPGSS